MHFEDDYTHTSMIT